MLSFSSRWSNIHPRWPSPTTSRMSLLYPSSTPEEMSCSQIFNKILLILSGRPKGRFWQRPRPWRHFKAEALKLLRVESKVYPVSIMLINSSVFLQFCRPEARCWSSAHKIAKDFRRNKRESLVCNLLLFLFSRSYTSLNLLDLMCDSILVSVFWRRAALKLTFFQIWNCVAHERGISIVFKVKDGPLIGEMNSEAQPNC